MLRRIITGIAIFLVLITAGFAAAASNPELAVENIISGFNTDLYHPAGYLIDNNLETNWGFKTGSEQGWAEFNLADDSLIYGLEVTGYLPRGTELYVEYIKGDYWAPFLAPVVTELDSTQIIDLSYDRVVTDKIRIRLSGSGVLESRLSEIKILGETAATIFHQIKPAEIMSSANSSPTTSADFLMDNNTHTIWQTQPDTLSKDLEEVYQKIATELNADTSQVITDSYNNISGEVIFNLDTSYQLNNVNIYFTEKAKGNLIVEAAAGDVWEELAYLPDGIHTGWYRLDLSGRDINTDRVRIIVNGSAGIQLGGIAEVQLWGSGSYQGNSQKLIGIQEPELISQAINRHFNLQAEQLKNNYLELAVQKEVEEPLSIELNGRGILIDPTFKLRGHTVYRYPLAEGTLWAGENFIRINPADDLLTLSNLRLIKDNHPGISSHSWTGLNDGLLLTTYGLTEASEIILEQETIVEEIKLFTPAENPYLNLYAQVEGNWTQLYQPEISSGIIKFRDPVKTSSLRIEGPAGVEIGEVQVLGSTTTDRKPAVKILYPTDNGVVDIKGIGKVDLIGFIDDSGAEVLVNGQEVERDGHYFWINYMKLGVRPWEIGELIATAIDSAGREAGHQVEVLLGEPPLITVDQLDEIMYTENDTITLSGSINRNVREITVNGVPAIITGKKVFGKGATSGRV